MDFLISKAEASAGGLTVYFTGKACKRGHIAPRNVKNETCLACASQRLKEARADDPDKFRQAANQRYAANPEPSKRRSKAIYWANVEINREKARTYQRKNFEKCSAKWAEWRGANADRKRASDAAYHKRHPEYARASTAARRARLKKIEGTHTPADIRRIRAAQRNKCAYCRDDVRDKYHVDHIVPLKLGGSNYSKNLQILCVACNTTKRALDPLVFAQRSGRLL